MRDYGTPEGLPTPDEMWAKLTGQDEKTELEKAGKRLARLQEIAAKILREQN